MIVVAGIIVVTASVLGGYLLEGGPVAVLVQPVEILIICGAAIGTLVISAPKHHLVGLAHGLVKLVRGVGSQQQAFLELLRLQYEIFINARKHGFIALERDVA